MDMTNRLLLVEPSTTMRYVLEKHAQSLGFAVDATESYLSAIESLSTQYQQFGNEYSGLLLGWPTAPQNEAAQLASVLEQDEYKDLPVVVMSTDMRAETRAWAAGRENTAVLAWREYQGLEELLQRLIEVAPDDSDTFPTKFDNRDIHLLVVDDSATIRYSLRDLFKMQGYNVSLAATRAEAMQLATDTAFDIAILDYYLTETTGDLLCRELMSSEKTGDLVCTVLTGTYSDHIIKRSLRAGAVECMFKNESSELLLSRVDAISRFVRQRRELQTERQLLENVIETVAGAVIIVDAAGRISYANDAAMVSLRQDNALAIVGQGSETLLELDGPKPPGDTIHSGLWRLPDGDTIAVDYQHSRFDSDTRSLIRFTPKKVSIDENTLKQALVDTGSMTETLIQHFDFEDDAAAVLDNMQHYLKNADELPERVSLLMLDVFAKDGDELTPIHEHETLQKTISSAINGIYKRSGHVARLRDNRYAFLLRHREEAQAYLMARKVMQLSLAIEHNEDNIKLACTGSLLSLIDNARPPISALIQHAFKGVDLVNSRGSNQVLLLDLRRMISAYPAQETQPKP